MVTRRNESISMHVVDIKRLYALWGKVYPYLAHQVSAMLPRGARPLLELGPFAGGITFALAKEEPTRDAVITDSREDLLDYLSREASGLDLRTQIRFVQTHLVGLSFGDAVFGGVIFRGAYFFLDGSMLREIHRILKPGGVGFIGGGYGALTPKRLIDEIATESRKLNARLGKRWVSRPQLEEMVKRAGLQHLSRIVEAGGLWLILEKG